MACNDLLGAGTPDNYVPIKFNDYPLFWSANTRTGSLLLSSSFYQSRHPLHHLLCPPSPLPVWDRACTLATTSQVEIQLSFNIVRMGLKSNCLLQNSTWSGWKTAEDSCQQINVPSVFLSHIHRNVLEQHDVLSFLSTFLPIPARFYRVKCRSTLPMELERGSRLWFYTIRLKCT